MTALTLRGVSARYGPRVVARAVDASVPAGSWLAIIGPNGAGKSSLLKSIVGVVEHDGEILLNDRTGKFTREIGKPIRESRGEVLTGLRLKSDRFGFEPEITAKVARKRKPSWRIFEIPISYSGRTYEEGKKIGLRDAISALFCIIRFWMFD